jgi:tetratricopeptide (TPR) repeat protein
MKASVLLDTLMQQESLDHERIQQVYDALPTNALVNDFRNALIEHQVMGLSEVMNIFIDHTLLPRSKTILTKLESDRKSRIHHKPEGHQQKFHIAEDDRLVEDIAFNAGELPIHIPSPNLQHYNYGSSDEKQAVMLAIELATMGELNEAEVVLLETLESFNNSLASILVLVWVYLCTDHKDQSEKWARRLLDQGVMNAQMMELLCLAEQLQNKHLMACSHYQKLLSAKKVKSIWYLLLAYSQEKSRCFQEAIENYRIYAHIGKDEQLKAYAQQHLQELSHL